MKNFDRHAIFNLLKEKKAEFIIECGDIDAEFKDEYQIENNTYAVINKIIRHYNATEDPTLLKYLKVQ